MRRSRSIVVTIAAGLVLAGCGGGDTSSSASPTPSRSGPTATSSDGSPVTSSCAGKHGDGKGAELSTVELKILGENLQVTYHTEEPVPTDETVLYTVDAWDMYGKTGYQLGTEINRRGQESQYVLAYPDKTRTDVQSQPQSTGTTLVATYPLAMMNSLGKKFQWSGTVKIGADPADSCPAVGGDPLQPNRVIFTR